MLKEIGSIFPLSYEEIEKAKHTSLTISENKLYYSLCRETIKEIITTNSFDNKLALLPAYTCQSVILPFSESGWEIMFYPVNKKLEIDLIKLQQLINQNDYSILLIHPFYGKDLSNEELTYIQKLKDIGIKIIIDLTQCIFSRADYSIADYIVGSYRKWFPIPDGAFLISKNSFALPKKENYFFYEKMTNAMYLRHCYFKNHESLMKEISIRLSKEADHAIEKNIESHRISNLSYGLLKSQDFEAIQQKRIDNFNCLSKNLKENSNLKPLFSDTDINSAPLYYVIYSTKRNALQQYLAQNAVYAPILWPVENEKVLVTDDIKYIYNSILAIPCDQRYDAEDMHRIATLVNNF